VVAFRFAKDYEHHPANREALTLIAAYALVYLVAP
jgi:hypothetical protein